MCESFIKELCLFTEREMKTYKTETESTNCQNDTTGSRWITIKWEICYKVTCLYCVALAFNVMFAKFWTDIHIFRRDPGALSQSFVLGHNLMIRDICHMPAVPKLSYGQTFKMIHLKAFCRALVTQFKAFSKRHKTGSEQTPWHLNKWSLSTLCIQTPR